MMDPSASLGRNLCFMLLLLLLSAMIGINSSGGGFALAKTLTELSETITFNPLVPLTHCMTVGEENDFKIEWSLNHAPKQSIEIRLTAAANKGFSALGFANQDAIQLATGYPAQDLPCARTLFDDATVYDIDGNPYPNFPELPAKVVWHDDYTVVHYAMRNLSITAATALRNGAPVPVNITMLWSYYMTSLYRGSCYGTNTMAFTEAPTFSVDLNDPRYLVSQPCAPYVGQIKPYRSFHPISHVLSSAIPPVAPLNGELQQNQRAVALLFGGGLLLYSGKAPPLFNGRVLGGEKANGVCSNSLTAVYAQWYGFSDKVGGITYYLVSIGTLAQPSRYVAGANAGTNLAFTAAVSLTPNVSYIVTVEAFNFAGLSTTIVSKPVTVLNAGKPVFGKMYSGTTVGSNVEFQQANSALSFVWTHWTTEEHAAKDYYTGAYTENGFQYALGIQNGDPEAVIPFTTVTHWKNDLTITGLSLVNGVTYVLTIRSLNCATQYTSQTSPGITIDYTPPLPGTVVFGNHSFTTRSTITMRNYVELSWFGFRDLLSGIAEYRWAMSTYRRPPSPSTNTYMILPWTSVGLSTHARSSQKLENIAGANTQPYGTAFYVHVMAIDRVGNSVVQTSNSSTLVTL